MGLRPEQCREVASDVLTSNIERKNMTALLIAVIFFAWGYRNGYDRGQIDGFGEGYQVKYRVLRNFACRK